jgi:hypothetical protein
MRGCIQGLRWGDDPEDDFDEDPGSDNGDTLKGGVAIDQATDSMDTVYNDIECELAFRSIPTQYLSMEIEESACAQMLRCSECGKKMNAKCLRDLVLT